MRKWLVASGLATLVFGGALVLLLLPSRQPHRVTIAFNGYTNDIRGVLAKLLIRNEGKGRIVRLGVYHLETSQRPVDPSRGIGFSPFFGRLLDPGQSETIAIPVVTNEGAWRAILQCESHGLRCRIREWLRSHKSFNRSWRLKIDGWLSRTPKTVIITEWIQPDGKPVESTPAIDTTTRVHSP